MSDHFSSEQEGKKTAGIQSNDLDSPNPDADIEDEENYHGHFGSTHHDRSDMYRMGKTQELRVRDFPINSQPTHIKTTNIYPQRNFRTLSALSFVVILQGTWEVLLTYGVPYPLQCNQFLTLSQSNNTRVD